MLLNTDLRVRVVENANVTNKILLANGFWGQQGSSARHLGATLSIENINEYRQNYNINQGIRDFINSIASIFDMIRESLILSDSESASIPIIYNEYEYKLLLDTLIFTQMHYNTKTASDSSFIYDDTMFEYFSDTILLHNIDLVENIHNQLYIHFSNYYLKTQRGNADKFLTRCGRLFKLRSDSSTNFHLMDNGIEIFTSQVSAEFIRKFELVDELKGKALDIFPYLESVSKDFNSGLSKRRLILLKATLKASSLALVKQGRNFCIHGGVVSNTWRMQYLVIIDKIDSLNGSDDLAVSAGLVRSAIGDSKLFYFKNPIELDGLSFRKNIGDYLRSLQLIQSRSKPIVAAHHLGYKQEGMEERRIKMVIDIMRMGDVDEILNYRRSLFIQSPGQVVNPMTERRRNVIDVSHHVTYTPSGVEMAIPKRNSLIHHAFAVRIYQLWFQNRTHIKNLNKLDVAKAFELHLKHKPEFKFLVLGRRKNLWNKIRKAANSTIYKEYMAYLRLMNDNKRKIRTADLDHLKKDRSFDNKLKSDYNLFERWLYGLHLRNTVSQADQRVEKLLKDPLRMHGKDFVKHIVKRKYDLERELGVKPYTFVAI